MTGKDKVGNNIVDVFIDGTLIADNANGDNAY